jgi:hypothetical protein
MDVGVTARAERFEARDFRAHIVGRNVEMHAAVMRHLLHFQRQRRGRGAEVEIRAGLVARADVAAERRGPEPRRRAEIVGAAVDAEAGDAAVMRHQARPPARRWRRPRRAGPARSLSRLFNSHERKAGLLGAPHRAAGLLDGDERADDDEGQQDQLDGHGRSLRMPFQGFF